MVIPRVHFCRDENAAWPRQALGSAPYWLNCFHYGFLVLLPICHELFLLLLLLFTAVFLGCNTYLMGDIYSWPHQRAAWLAGVGWGVDGRERFGSEENSWRQLEFSCWQPPSIFNGGVASPLRLHCSHRLFISRRRVIKSGTIWAGGGEGGGLNPEYFSTSLFIYYQILFKFQLKFLGLGMHWYLLPVSCIGPN